ncbi:MAG: hypothetical protein RBU30_14830 [Polyangia bacterium]|jgi:hypothetical protein|nr:hypothetical protein [Polyangia bacterium]
MEHDTKVRRIPVPEDIARRLKADAALRGESLARALVRHLEDSLRDKTSPEPRTKEQAR